MHLRILIYAAFIMRFVAGPGCNTDQHTTNGCSDLHNEPVTSLITVALGMGFSNDSVQVYFSGRQIYDSLATTDSSGYAWVDKNVQADVPEYNGLSVTINPGNVVSSQRLYIEYGNVTVLVNYIRDERRIEVVLK